MTKLGTAHVGSTQWERPIIDLTPASFSGELRKQNRRTSSWSQDKRLFEIRTHCLVWQRKRAWFLSTGGTEILDLRGASIEVFGPMGKNMFPFCVVSADQEYTLGLAASSEYERCRWILEIKLAGLHSDLNRDFEPLAVIGKGKWGKVYLARDRQVRRTSEEEREHPETLLAIKEIELKKGLNITNLLNERLVLGSLPESPFGKSFVCLSPSASSNDSFYLRCTCTSLVR